MAYVPKKLFVGRCVRCGKPAYRGDDFYKCQRCNLLVCPICERKLGGRCPVCQSSLTEL